MPTLYVISAVYFWVDTLLLELGRSEFLLPSAIRIGFPNLSRESVRRKQNYNIQEIFIAYYTKRLFRDVASRILTVIFHSIL